ncbi:MAG: hypothetical protein V1913_17290 [Fibrobacterota bacterium]
MRFLLQGLSLRLIAFLCALLLWIYVTLNKKYDAILDVPLRLANIPEALAPAGPLPGVAKVVVAGRGRQLLMLKYAAAELRLDCSAARRGPQTFPLTRDNVELYGAGAASVVHIKSPESVTVLFDARVNKEVTVVAVLDASPAGGRILVGEPEVLPAAVVLSGPRCNTAAIDTLSTETLVLPRLRDDTVVVAAVRVPAQSGLSVSPESVLVRIRVETVVKRTLTGIPVRLTGAPEKAPGSLDVKTVSLVVAGPEQEVKGLSPDLVNVFVRYTRFSEEGLTEVEPSVSIVGNVQWSNLEPKKVRLVKGKPGGLR